MIVVVFTRWIFFDLGMMQIMDKLASEIKYLSQAIEPIVVEICMVFFF